MAYHYLMIYTLPSYSLCCGPAGDEGDGTSHITPQIAPFGKRFARCPVQRAGSPGNPLPGSVTTKGPGKKRSTKRTGGHGGGNRFRGPSCASRTNKQPVRATPWGKCSGDRPGPPTPLRRFVQRRGLEHRRRECPPVLPHAAGIYGFPQR